MKRNILIAIIVLLCIPLAYKAMAAKGSAYTAITAAAGGDTINIVDVSDNATTATGTTHKITVANLVYPPTVGCSDNCTITAEQALRGCDVTNFGQGAADKAALLPTAAANMNVNVVIGTTQAANYWRLNADGYVAKIYLDGSSTAKTWVGFAAPTKGNFFSCKSFQTGASTWEWICSTGAGTTSTN